MLIDLDAVVIRFSDRRHLAVSRHAEPAGVMQFALAFARFERVESPLVEPLPLKVEDLHAVIGAVADIDALSCYLDPCRISEETRRPAPIAPAEEVCSFSIVDLNAVVSTVADIDALVLPYGEICWIEELLCAIPP
jgi:hypothetical protein